MATTLQLAEEYVEILGRSTPQVLNAQQYIDVLVVPVKPAANTAEIYMDVLVVRPPEPAVFIGWGVPL